MPGLSNSDMRYAFPSKRVNRDVDFAVNAKTVWSARHPVEGFCTYGWMVTPVFLHIDKVFCCIFEIHILSIGYWFYEWWCPLWYYFSCISFSAQWYLEA